MAERRKLNEIYTVEDTTDGSWATWKAAMGKEGTYVLSLLCARENSEEESYKEIARVSFLSDDSAQLVIFHELMPTRVRAALFLPHVLMAYGVRVRGYEIGSGAGELPKEFELLPATRCNRCNRLLTRPLSIRTGVGDECGNRKPRAGSKYARAKQLGSPEEMLSAIRQRRQEREAAKKFKLPTR
jgi:hypothetical protein